MSKITEWFGAVKRAELEAKAKIPDYPREVLHIEIAGNLKEGNHHWIENLEMEASVEVVIRRIIKKTTKFTWEVEVEYTGRMDKMKYKKDN